MAMGAQGTTTQLGMGKQLGTAKQLAMRAEWAMTSLRDWRDYRRRRAAFCPPQGFKADDALAAVLGHARYASAADGMDAAGFVRFALEDAYPCPIPVGAR